MANFASGLQWAETAVIYLQGTSLVLGNVLISNFLSEQDPTHNLSTRVTLGLSLSGSCHTHSGSLSHKLVGSVGLGYC